MPLSHQYFNNRALTDAINLLPKTPRIISDLGIFQQSFKNTTYVEIERGGFAQSLVEAKPRGATGEPVSKWREAPKMFKMLHLPYDDFVGADDVQNIRDFGTVDGIQAVADVVNDKFMIARESFDRTREHAMFGALKGNILNKDGKTILLDVYQEWGETRKEWQWQLSSDKTDVSNLLDAYVLELNKRMRGESKNGIVAFVSAEFYSQLLTHKSIKDIYARYNQGEVYRINNVEVGFKHKNVHFIVYAEEFESGLKLDDDEGIILPLGTRNSFREYFAPANMVSTVNQKAKPYYASRESLGHDKGYSLHAQCNPLPLVLRPDLVQTIRLT